MNLTQFLKQVDTAVMNMPQEKLAAFIHTIARSLPESQREMFIKKILDMTDVAGPQLKEKTDEKENG